MTNKIEGSKNSKTDRFQMNITGLTKMVLPSIKVLKYNASTNSRIMVAKSWTSLQAGAMCLSNQLGLLCSKTVNRSPMPLEMKKNVMSLSCTTTNMDLEGSHVSKSAFG